MFKRVEISMTRPFLLSFLVTFGLVVNAEEIAKTWASKAAHQQAVEFAPGVISKKDSFEINAVFNQAGDKVVFARCANDFSTCTMMESRFIDGSWQEGVRLPFAEDYLEADPYYNADFSKIYFISKRPIVKGGEASKTVNFWRVSEINGKWGVPEYLAEMSSDADDLYPSFTDAGDLYFPSFRNNQRLLYVAKPQGQGYSAPVAIPASVYGENAKIGDSAIKPLSIALEAVQTARVTAIFISHTGKMVSGLQQKV